MKIFSNLIFIALGLIISSALIQHMQVPAHTLLMAGIGLFIVSVLLSFITHNSAAKPQKQNKKTKQKTKATPKKIKSNNGPTVTGSVKWYNKTKGFGFITQENGDDIFVHQSALAFKGGTLKDGQSVTMQVVIDEKNRPQAENVKKA
jgi:CspA family cold shock protein